MLYRLNFLDECGQVIRALDIEARSDDAARMVAEAYSEGGPMELWRHSSSRPAPRHRPPGIAAAPAFLAVQL